MNFFHQWQNRKYIIFYLTIRFFCKNATVVNHGFGIKSPNFVCVSCYFKIKIIDLFGINRH
ncbi:unnamed protein product [Brassica oleracea]|uniref:(rape) hypothetical protein n=1 Tax=Brassica napus TaxID=3708 RepID=A0A816HYW1_BRANA|nr:unnamed protein product [Brassica napus]